MVILRFTLQKKAIKHPKQSGAPIAPLFYNTKTIQMIYLNSRVETLGRAQTVRIANMALRWCRTNMGTNNRKKYQPIWSVVKGWGDDCGEYDATDNEVHIYYNNCYDVRELIGTCIHEWTHQLQPILTKYDAYPGTYSRNPYERQARRNEDKYLKPCWTHIKLKLKLNKK